MYQIPFSTIKRIINVPKIQIHTVAQSKLCHYRIACLTNRMCERTLWRNNPVFSPEVEYPLTTVSIWRFWRPKYSTSGRLLNFLEKFILSFSLRLVDVRSAVRCLQGVHWEVSRRVDWRRLRSGWLGCLDQNERSSRYSACWVWSIVAVNFILAMLVQWHHVNERC